jgi:hypothetical protein
MNLPKAQSTATDAQSTFWPPQALYTWALLPLLGLRWHFMEILDLLRMNHLGRPISPVRAPCQAFLKRDIPLERSFHVPCQPLQPESEWTRKPGVVQASPGVVAEREGAP